MTHTVDGEGYRSVVRLVLVTERLGLIGGLLVREDGTFAGLLLLLPAHAVYRRVLHGRRNVSKIKKKEMNKLFKGLNRV